MPKFNVLVTTTFDGYVEIDASSREEAMSMAREMVWSGEINCVDQFEPFTEVMFAEEIENA